MSLHNVQLALTALAVRVAVSGFTFAGLMIGFAALLAVYTSLWTDNEATDADRSRFRQLIEDKGGDVETFDADSTANLYPASRGGLKKSYKRALGRD